MAPAPTFVADLDTLKAQLRLSGVYDSAEDTQRIIERAVLRVRLDLVQKLGTALITTLLATAYSENPSTDAQRNRAYANLLEIELVKCLLLCELKQHFTDSSGAVREEWNTNGVFRSEPPGGSCCDQEFIDLCVQLLTGSELESETLTFTTAPGANRRLKPRLRSNLLRNCTCPTCGCVTCICSDCCTTCGCSPCECS